MALEDFAVDTASMGGFGNRSYCWNTDLRDQTIIVVSNHSCNQFEAGNTSKFTGGKGLKTTNVLNPKVNAMLKLLVRYLNKCS